MTNKYLFPILRALLIILPFGLFFLKIYNLYYYIPILVLAFFISYNDYKYLAPEKRFAFILPKVLAIIVLIFLYLKYLNRV